METKQYILLAAATIHAGSLDENGNAKLDHVECLKRAHELWNTLIEKHGDGILTAQMRAEALSKQKGA